MRKIHHTNCLHLLAGIAPPDIRRGLANRRERQKAKHDPSHMLYGSEVANQGLKSRKSFLHTIPPLNMPSEEMRIELWKNRLRECRLKLDFNIEPAEVLAPGHQASEKTGDSLTDFKLELLKPEAHLQSGDFIMARLCVSVVLQLTLQNTCLDALYFHRSAVETTF